MSTNDLEGFLTDLQKDERLRAEFEALDSDPETWIRWAKSKGYLSFTLEDAGRLAVSRDIKISDDDLENVAGGWCGNETTTG